MNDSSSMVHREQLYKTMENYNQGWKNGSGALLKSMKQMENLSNYQHRYTVCLFKAPPIGDDKESE